MRPLWNREGGGIEISRYLLPLSRQITARAPVGLPAAPKQVSRLIPKALERKE